MFRYPAREAVRTLMLLLGSVLALSACHPRGRAPRRAWRWENPTPQGNTLNAACVDGAGVGYAVGQHGAVMVRERGVWRALPSQARAHLYALACDDREVIAVGDDGTALRSTDRGARWSRVDLGTRAKLRAVVRTPEGWWVAGEGTLLRGSSISRMRVAATVPGAVHALWFHGRVGVAVGPQGAILRSEDGGARWTPVESGTQRTLTALWGSGPDDLYAVGADGVILVSGDAGARWTLLPRITHDDLRAVQGVGRRDIYVVGASGTVLRSRDGVQLVREDSGAPGDLLGVAVRGDDVFAVGVRGSVVTRERSGRWRLLPGGHRGTLHAVWRGRDGTTCAVGQGGAILCRDGSLGWIPMPSGVRANLAGIAGDDAGVLVAVGDYGTVLRSTDRGRAWTLLPTGEGGTLPPGDTTSPTWAQLPTRENRALSAVWMGDDGRGLLVGRDGIILRTTDRGASWQRVRHPHRDGLFGVWALPDGRAWACGVGGAILHSTDHGAQWSRLSQPLRQDLFAVWSDDRETLVVGRQGATLRATDGAHFAPLTSATTLPLLSVTGRGNERWAASINGAVLRMRRGGARWVAEDLRTGDDFTAVHAAHDGTLTAVGYWGTLLTSP